MPDTTNQMIVDAWNNRTAYFKALGQSLPARDTGIFNAWRREWLAGRYRGPVESQEYDTVDTRGVKVRAQDFGGSICHWYPLTSVAVWV